MQIKTRYFSNQISEDLKIILLLPEYNETCMLSAVQS